MYGKEHLAAFLHYGAGFGILFYHRAWCCAGVIYGIGNYAFQSLCFKKRDGFVVGESAHSRHRYGVAMTSPYVKPKH